MDPRLQPYSRRSDELSVEENCLLWATRVIIPQKLQSRVLADLHENHLDSNRIKALARSYILWPSLDMTLEELCKKLKFVKVRGINRLLVFLIHGCIPQHLA